MLFFQLSIGGNDRSGKVTEDIDNFTPLERPLEDFQTTVVPGKQAPTVFPQLFVPGKRTPGKQLKIIIILCLRKENSAASSPLYLWKESTHCVSSSLRHLEKLTEVFQVTVHRKGKLV